MGSCRGEIGTQEGEQEWEVEGRSPDNNPHLPDNFLPGGLGWRQEKWGQERKKEEGEDGQGEEKKGKHSSFH